MVHRAILANGFVFVILTALVRTVRCEWMEVRLVDGNTPAEGRLEIRISDASRVLAAMDQVQKWVTVCDDKWKRAESLVACRMLGFHNSSAVRYGSASDGGNGVIGPSVSFPAGSGDIFHYHIKCSGTEGMLTQCAFEARGHCTKHEDVSLQCAKLAPTITTTTKPTTTAAPPKVVPQVVPPVELMSRRQSRPPAPERSRIRAQPQEMVDYDKLRRDYEQQQQQQQAQRQREEQLRQQMEQMQRRLHESETANARLRQQQDETSQQYAARLRELPQDQHVAAALHRTNEAMLTIARDAAASAAAASLSADNVQSVAKDLSSMKHVVHDLHTLLYNVSNRMPTKESLTSIKQQTADNQPDSSKTLLESTLLILDQTRVLENITLVQQDELEALIEDVDKKHEQLVGTLHLLLQVMAVAGGIGLLVILGLLIFCCCMARKQKQMTSTWGTAANKKNKARRRYDTDLTHAEEGDSLYGTRSTSSNTLNTFKPDKIVRLNNTIGGSMSTSV